MALKLKDLVARLRIVADKKTQKDTEAEVSSGFSRITKMAAAAGAAIASAFAINKIVDFGKASVAEAAESQKAWARLGTTLEGAGVKFSAAEGQLRALSEAFADATVHGDDDFAVVLQRLVSLTGDYENSLKNVGLVANTAAKYFDGNLEPATKVVADAMNGLSRGLREVGIITKDAQAGLQILAERTMGEATARTKTLAGQVERLNNLWGEFKESVGNALIEAGSGTSILDTLSASVKAMTRWVEANSGMLKSFADNLMAVGRAAGYAAKQLAQLIKPAEAAAGDELEQALKVAKGDPKALASRLRIEGENFKQLAEQARALRAEITKVEEKAASVGGKPGLLFAEQAKNMGAALAELDTKIHTSTLVIDGLKKAILEAGKAKADVFGGAGASRGGGAPGMATPGAAGGVVPIGTGFPLIRTPATAVQQLEREDPMQTLAQQWIDTNAMMIDSAFAAAGSIEQAFGDAFAALGEEGKGLQEGFGALFEGLGQGVLEFIQHWARMKVQFNLGEMIEKLALAAAAAVLNPPAVGPLLKSAGTHAAAMLAWSALAGGAGAVAGGGGRGGGGSTSVPGGTRMAGDAQHASPQTIVVHIDPFNPRNPVHADTGRHIVKSAGRMDSSINAARRKGSKTK